MRISEEIMSFLRTCGLRVIQTTGSGQISAKFGGDVVAFRHVRDRCGECRRLSLLRSECRTGADNKGRVFKIAS